MAGEMIAESGNLPTDAVQTASAKELLVDTDTPQ